MPTIVIDNEIIKNVTEFYTPDLFPEYGNSQQYLLWVSCCQDDATPEVPFADELIWGMWHENQWWIIADDYEMPHPEDTQIGNDDEPLEAIFFEKFSNQTFFTLKGWKPLWGGSKPNFKNQSNLN